MLKFVDLWVVISSKLTHVDWSFGGKFYLHHHGSCSRYSYRTSALNIARHVPEKEDGFSHLGGNIGPGRTVAYIGHRHAPSHTHTHTHTHTHNLPLTIRLSFPL